MEAADQVQVPWACVRDLSSSCQVLPMLVRWQMSRLSILPMLMAEVSLSEDGIFGVLLRALAYILTLGRENLKMVGPLATLNANYIKECLKDEYLLPIEGLCKHEFVFDGLRDESTGVTTMDVAKRLLDYGYHAPTIYFPLLFHESLMIEPTENESKDTIDGFVAVMRKIAEEALNNPDVVKSAPHNTPIGRVDDVLAAKHPVVKYKDIEA